MPDFIYKLFKRVKYYFNGAGKTQPSSIQQLEKLLVRLTQGKIASYEILVHGRRTVELRTEDIETLLSEFEYAIETIAKEGVVDLAYKELKVLAIDDWFCDADGRYLKSTDALTRLKKSATDFVAAYNQIKLTNESKAEYYRLRFGVLADDANAVIKTILE